MRRASQPAPASPLRARLLWLFALLLLLGPLDAQKQVTTTGTYTSSTATTTTSTTSVTSTTTTTTTRTSCLNMPCPDGYRYKHDVQIRVCAEEVCDPKVDVDNCCDEVCFGDLRCPIFYTEKTNLTTYQCDGRCDGTDVVLCCDMAEPCANFTCPDSYALKQDIKKKFCKGVQCDPADDLDQCCDQECGNFECPARSKLKEAASETFCFGTCDYLRDRQTCCDYVAALNDSALMLRAAIHSDERQVDQLIRMRAEVASGDTDFHMAHGRDTTALHFAALQGNAAILRRLGEANGDLQARDVRGWTPLHAAAGRGHVEACRALLELRADPVLRTDAGLTARDILLKSSPLKKRYPKELEALLAHAERRRTEELHHARYVHVDSDLLEDLRVQRGLRAWLQADRPGHLHGPAKHPPGAPAGGETLTRWFDRSGRGASAIQVDDGPAPRMGGSIGHLPAVHFRAGDVLQAAVPLRCKTVALVVQHGLLTWRTRTLLSLVDADVMLRVSDPVRGYWRNRAQAGKALEKRDWQYRHPHKVWLNGDSDSQTWEGFPTAPVVVIGVRHVGRGEGEDLLYRLGGHSGFDGFMGEVLVWDRELSEREVQSVNAYLMHKWSIGKAHRRTMQDEL